MDQVSTIYLRKHRGFHKNLNEKLWIILSVFFQSKNQLTYVNLIMQVESVQRSNNIHVPNYHHARP